MAGHNINISDMAFDPPEIDIHAGDTVTWTNLDVMGHSACRDNPPAFDTGLIAQGSTSSAVQFQSQGAFDYFCRQHRFMTAKIVVT